MKTLAALGLQTLVKPRSLKTRGFIYEDREFSFSGPYRRGLHYIGGINDEGHMTGWYRKGGESHGFVAGPVPLPGSFWLFGASLLSLALTLRSSLMQGNPPSSPSPNSDERSS